VKRTVLIVVLGLVGIGGVWTLFRLGGSSQFAGATDQQKIASLNASTSSARSVVALGRIEPAGGFVSIRGLVGERVESLHVNEGDIVQRGQKVATLGSHRLRQLEIDALDVQIKEAETRLAAEQQLADARIAAAQVAVDQAAEQDVALESQRKRIELLKASLELERKDLARLSGLSQKLVSPQQTERQALVVKKAEAELAAAQALLEQMDRDAQYVLATARAKLSTAKAAKQQVTATGSLASLKQSRQSLLEQLEHSTVVSPATGTVLDTYIRSGELIDNRPILRLADLTRPICVAEVYETEVKRVRVGQKAMIRSRAFPAPADQEGISGRVVHVEPMINSPELHSLDPFAPADRRVVEVRIELESPSSEVAGRLLNLQVDVTFFPADES